jgi:predicted SAM-dependent methyltransferase
MKQKQVGSFGLTENQRLFVYLGAGSDRISGFTHMEYSVSKAQKRGKRLKQPEILGDITKGLPFNDNSVDVFYTIHTFEHLTYVDLQNCLLSCLRKLKSGGVLRIVVPDLDCMIRDYLSQASFDSRDYEVNLEFPMDTPTQLFISRVLYHDHKYLLNFEILSNLLREVGFQEFSQVGPGESAVAVLRNVFLEKELNRIGGDLIVEATKTTLLSESNQSLSSKRFSLPSFLNLKLTRINKTLPRFPELLWFQEKIYKSRRKRFVYWSDE